MLLGARACALSWLLVALVPLGGVEAERPEEREHEADFKLVGAHNGPPGGAKKGQSEPKKKDVVPEVAKIAEQWFENNASTWFKEKVLPVIDEIQELVEDFEKAVQAYDQMLDGPPAPLTDEKYNNDFYGGARKLMLKFKAVKEKNQEAGATFGDSLREAVKTDVVMKVRNNAEFLSVKAFNVCVKRWAVKSAADEERRKDTGYTLREINIKCSCQFKDLICAVNSKRNLCNDKALSCPEDQKHRE